MAILTFFNTLIIKSYPVTAAPYAVLNNLEQGAAVPCPYLNNL
jgi:hypothetical protein